MHYDKSKVQWKIQGPMNILDPGWTCDLKKDRFLGYVPKSDIGGSHDSSDFTLLRNLHINFYNSKSRERMICIVSLIVFVSVSVSPSPL